LITPPGWSGAVPEGMTRINTPTLYVWIAGRTKTDGSSDYDVVRKIRAGYKVKPLSEWGAAAGSRLRSFHPTVSAFPEMAVGSAYTSSFSGLARRSLALRPAHSRCHQFVTR